jgi:hypothetical protein
VSLLVYIKRVASGIKMNEVALVIILAGSLLRSLLHGSSVRHI